MKEYDFIVIGTGSGMEIASALLENNPKMRAAVIDKDEPGGICLTRGCIPSKILLYPAELVRTIERAKEFGISVELKNIDFQKVMQRMKTLIYEDINKIRQGLSRSKNIDYFTTAAEFVAPYTLKVGNEMIRSKMIFLCTGSKPSIPRIEDLEKVAYQTSDTILKMDHLPESIAIIGGGYDRSIDHQIGNGFQKGLRSALILGKPFSGLGRKRAWRLLCQQSQPWAFQNYGCKPSAYS